MDMHRSDGVMVDRASVCDLEQQTADHVDDSTADCSLESLWQMLESAQWAPHALQTWLPHALTRADELAPHARIAWMLRLREAARRHWALSPLVKESLLALAAQWCDWPMVIAIGEQYEAAGTLPAWAARWMVEACFRLGQTQTALERCRSLALRDPSDRGVIKTYGRLLQWHRFVDQSVPPIVGSMLTLEPLGHHHAVDFAHQYYDPDIAERCCLPAFTNEPQWHQWLDDNWGHGDQRLYAVVHAEWGVIGSVSLILHGDTGFFYYWLGRDFHGYGWGPEAARLLLDDAGLHRGMRTCYAKVFISNTCSRRALEKIGFMALDISPAPPNEAECFYRLGPAQTREHCVAGLRTLFERMGSDIRVAVPLSDDWRQQPSAIRVQGSNVDIAPLVCPSSFDNMRRAL